MINVNFALKMLRQDFAPLTCLTVTDKFQGDRGSLFYSTLQDNEALLGKIFDTINLRQSVDFTLVEKNIPLKEFIFILTLYH